MGTINPSSAATISPAYPDRIGNLKRDLLFLRGKKERLVVKKRELEVEEQLLNQKIHSLEEELRTEEKRAKSALAVVSNSSIDATISEVIANVMCNASSSSFSNSFATNSDVNSFRNTNGSTDVRTNKTNNVASTSSRNGLNPVFTANAEVPLRNPFLVQNGEQSNFQSVPLPSISTSSTASSSSDLHAGLFSLNWGNLSTLPQQPFHNLPPQIFCMPNDQTGVHQNALLNAISMSRSRFSPTISTATSSTSSTLNSATGLSRTSNKVSIQRRTVSSSSSNDAFDNVLPGGKDHRILFQSLPLAFADVRTLIAPSLIETDSFTIEIPQQLVKLFIQDKFNVVLRMCIYKRHKEYQSDRMARAIKITINSIPVLLAKNSAKAIKSPITITSLLMHTQNKVVITLPENNNRNYAVGVYALRKIPIGETLSQLKLQEFLRTETETLEIIKRKFSSNSDIVSESIKVPITCPITKRRLMLPAIGSKCEHLSCFEAQTFLEMNLNKDEWICPVCNRPIGTAELISDGLTVKILNTLESKCLQVEFFVDGSYKPVIEKPVENTVNLGKKSSDILLIDLSDDNEEEGEDSFPQPIRRPLAPAFSQQKTAEPSSRFRSTYSNRNCEEDYRNEGETQNNGSSIIDHEHSINNTLGDNTTPARNENQVSHLSDIEDLHEDSKRRRTHSPSSRRKDSDDDLRRGAFYRRKGR